MCHGSRAKLAGACVGGLWDGIQMGIPWDPQKRYGIYCIFQRIQPAQKNAWDALGSSPNRRDPSRQRINDGSKAKVVCAANLLLQGYRCFSTPLVVFHNGSYYIAASVVLVEHGSYYFAASVVKWHNGSNDF